MEKDRVKEVLGVKDEHKKSDKKKKKRVHEMRVRRAANKGYIAQHHFKPEEDEQGMVGAPPEPEDHIIPDMEQMKNHFSENMSEEESEMSPEEQMMKKQQV